MKLVVVIFFTCLMQVSASTFGQRITLSEKNATIREVLNKIKAQSGFEVVYIDEQLEGANKVNLRFNDLALETALEQVFKNQPLTYTIKDNTIIVKEKTPSFLDLPKPAFANIDARGKILDESGKPLEGATVVLKGTDRTTKTDAKGEFVIPNVPNDAVLVIRYVGYKALEIPVKGANMPLEIKLNQLTGQLEEVAVKGNTGYQVIDKNHPGSFDVINNDLLNRSTSSTILERIQSLTPGLLFDKSPGAQEAIVIRGKNSINLSATPLIVLDNFPYDGDINNINPNDLESVTILKDAAAASIWGARAGNGVIVLTSKKGKTDKPQVSLTSNLTVTEKTNLFSAQTISPNDFVDLEQFLFDRGFYNGAINNARTLITPGVDIMAKKRSGNITADQATVQLSSLRQNDVRNDLMKYFYRSAISQQNHLNISGNSTSINYYMGAGWDRNVSDVVGKDNNRINLNSRVAFRVNPKLEFDAAIGYTRNKAKSGNNIPSSLAAGKMLFPYADLIDDTGNALVLIRDFKASYLNGFTNKDNNLLDWTYKPYNEIDARETSNKTNDFVLNSSMRYQILSGLFIDGYYQFQNQLVTFIDLYKQEDYYTRNLINRFYQGDDPANKYPIPVGGIVTNTNAETISHQGRVQLNYNQIFGRHQISGMAGWEIKNLLNKVNGYRVYGYQREGNAVATSIDHKSFYSGVLGAVGTIPSNISTSEKLNRFISSYVNMTYTFNDKYLFYGSVREDAANLFGVKSNQKGTPLWAVGGTWCLDKEDFYKLSWLPNLKLKANYGYSGNSSPNTMALTTIYREIGEEGRFALIGSVPNENLRWERNGRLGFGLDFTFKNNRISGSIEYYRSNNIDLISQAPIDPTLGVSRSIDALFTQNVASVNGKGIELSLQANIVDSRFKWKLNANFSYAYTEISKLLIPIPTQVSSYVPYASILEGKPIGTVYGYRWGGLDPLTGDPQGYLGNTITKNYIGISQNTKIDSLVYFGQSSAPIFGNLRNTLHWKTISLSFNIGYQLGYYFRRNSVNYSDLFTRWTGHSDYAKRWQKPGDENSTSVPSMTYPANSMRDAFYINSEELVEKGDHFRLEDIQLSYSFVKKPGSNMPFQRISVNSNLRNLNLLLWKANKYTDPNFSGYARPGKVITFGLNLVL